MHQRPITLDDHGHCQIIVVLFWMQVEVAHESVSHGHTFAMCPYLADFMIWSLEIGTRMM